MTLRARLLRLRHLFWLAVLPLIWWALREVSLQEVWDVLAGLSLVQILALVAANGVVLFTLSGRWWLILRSQGYSIPYLALLGYRLAAFGISYFTPGPQFGGEPLQVYSVQRRYGVPRSTAVAAVTLDKSLELLSNFTFLTLGVIAVLHWQIFEGLLGSQVVFVALALLALPLGFLLVLWSGRRPVSGLLRVAGKFLPRRWERRRNKVTSFFWSARRAVEESEGQAVDFCRQHPWTLGLALLVSAVSWMAMLGEFWFAFHLLGLSLTPVQLISALTAARIAFLLPMPGGLGTLEASQVLALSALGLNPAMGISLAVLIRVRDVALGGLGLWWGGIGGLALR